MSNDVTDEARYFIVDVDRIGEIVVLDDLSRWKIAPANMDYVTQWQQGDSIIVATSADSMYDHTLINAETGAKVAAVDLRGSEDITVPRRTWAHS